MRYRIFILLYIDCVYNSFRTETGEFPDLEAAKEHARTIWKEMPPGKKQIFILNADTGHNLFYKDNFILLPKLPMKPR